MSGDANLPGTQNQIALPACRDVLSRHLHAKLRRQADEIFAHVNHLNRRQRKSQALCQPRTKHLIYQNPRMLRVILDLITVLICPAH
jgi:hypothetical protein